MKKTRESSTNRSPFSEARKMIAGELYVPSKWGKVAVDNSGREPKIVYKTHSTEPDNQQQEAK